MIELPHMDVGHFSNLRVSPSSERLHNQMHRFDVISQMYYLMSGRNNVRYAYRVCGAFVASCATAH